MGWRPYVYNKSNLVYKEIPVEKGFMYKILRKQVLSHSIKLMEIKVPLVANKAKPGQFVIVRMNETGERIPLTIADFSQVDGSITVIFQEVGKSNRN